MRRPRLPHLALLACLPAAGMLLAFGTAAGASSTAGASTAAARGRQAAAARTLLQHLSVGQHSADQRVPGHSARSGACPR